MGKKRWAMEGSFKAAAIIRSKLQGVQKSYPSPNDNDYSPVIPVRKWAQLFCSFTSIYEFFSREFPFLFQN